MPPYTRPVPPWTTATCGWVLWFGGGLCDQYPVRMVTGLACGACLGSVAAVYAAPESLAPAPSQAELSPPSDTYSGVERPERKLAVAVQYGTRYALQRGVPEVNELTIPHGLTDLGQRGGVLAIVGGLLPKSDVAPTVMTMILALEAEPLPWLISPFLNAGAGGYLVLGRGAGRAEAPRVEWLWASSASAGVKLNFDGWVHVPVNVRAFGQAFWVETPFIPLEVTFSGWGWGVGLEYQFDVPDVHLIRQFSHGDGMADGW